MEPKISQTSEQPVISWNQIKHSHTLEADLQSNLQADLYLIHREYTLNMTAPHNMFSFWYCLSFVNLGGKIGDSLLILFLSDEKNSQYG